LSENGRKFGYTEYFWHFLCPVFVRRTDPKGNLPKRCANMLRIIVERRANNHWAASWLDEPTFVVHSGSPLGAVAKLLIHSPDRHVSASDLETDPMASGPGRLEMVVIPRQTG
jgi:hypothetical protein